jgi:mRNA interferase RelE/StbE
MYQILFASGLDKDLKKIPKADQKRIISKVESLAEDPFPSGDKPLQGNLSGYYRIRTGNYRIVYSVDKDIPNSSENFTFELRQSPAVERS